MTDSNLSAEVWTWQLWVVSPDLHQANRSLHEQPVNKHCQLCLMSLANNKITLGSGSCHTQWGASRRSLTSAGNCGWNWTTLKGCLQHRLGARRLSVTAVAVVTPTQCFATAGTQRQLTNCDCSGSSRHYQGTCAAPICAYIGLGATGLGNASRLLPSTAEPTKSAAPRVLHQECVTSCAGAQAS